MRNIKYFACILITILTQTDSQLIYSNMRRYLNDESQNQFYVSIGLNEEIASFMLHQYRSWQPLYVLNNKQDAKSVYLSNKLASMIFAKGSKQEESMLQYSLSQICESYYIKTPKILTITPRKDMTSLLESNNWTNNLCLPQSILIQHQGNSKQIVQYLKKTGYTKQEQTKNILYFTKSTDATIQSRQPFLSATPYLPLSKILQNVQQLVGNNPNTLYFMADQYLFINSLFNFSSPQQQSIFVLNFNPITDFVVLQNSYTITFLQSSRNSSFYKFAIYQDVSLPQYFMFVPAQPKMALNIMRAQYQNLCYNQPQILMIQDIIQVPKVHSENLKRGEKIQQQKQQKQRLKQVQLIENNNSQQDQQDYLVIAEDILLIVLLIIISCMLMKFIKNRKLDPLKHQYKMAAYSKVSKIEDFPEKHIYFQDN